MSGARPSWKQIGLDDIDLPRQAKPGDILARARQGARVLVGGDDVLDPSPRQHRSQHAGSGADIEGPLRRRQRRFGHQLQVLAAHRRKHAVVRVDALAERRDIDALLAPLVGADHAEQFAQRDHRGLPAAHAPYASAQASLHIRRAPQGNTVIRLQRQQQHAQGAGALGLGLAMKIEGLDWRRWRACAACGRCGAPWPAATGAHSGNRRATAARCPRWPGDRRHPPSCGHRQPSRAWAAARRSPSASGRIGSRRLRSRSQQENGGQPTELTRLTHNRQNTSSRKLYVPRASCGYP